MDEMDESEHVEEPREGEREAGEGRLREKEACAFLPSFFLGPFFLLSSFPSPPSLPSSSILSSLSFCLTASTVNPPRPPSLPPSLPPFLNSKSRKPSGINLNITVCTTSSLLCHPSVAKALPLLPSLVTTPTSWSK